MPSVNGKRVLLLAPTRRDAEVTQTLVLRAGLECLVCADVAELGREAAIGAGTILATGESLAKEDPTPLLTVLEEQPPWSDLPVILLVQGGVQSPVAARIILALRNVTLLERPASTRAVISAVQAAVRGR